MPSQQGLIWPVGLGEAGWGTQHFYPFQRETQMSKKKLNALRGIFG